MCKDAHGKRAFGWGICLALTGIALVLVAALVPPALRGAVNNAVYKTFLVDSPDASGYKSWSNSSDPDAPGIYMHFYLYNITNLPELIAGGKPRIEEVGPFIFKENQMMLNTTWSEDGDVVKYVMWDYYTPVEPINPLYYQNITTVRMPFLLFDVLGLGVADYPEFWASHNKTSELLFVTQSVQDALWGAHDQLIADLLADLQFVLDVLHLNVTLQFNKAPGFFTNITTEKDAMDQLGYITMYTGKHTQYRAREYLTWNDQASLQCCSSGTCGAGVWDDARSTWAINSPDANRIRGGNGDQFRHGVEKGGTLPVFVDQMFRALNIRNVNETTVTVKDIDLLRFVVPAEEFHNASIDPSQAAYYSFGASGLVNISNCNMRIPLFVSKPHFLDGSPELYTTNVNITAPDRALHDSYVDVEPITGATMQVAERLQGNVKIGPEPGVLYPNPLYPNLPHTVMPLFWVSKEGIVSDKSANDFKGSIYLAKKLELGVLIGGIVLGVLLFGGGVVMAVKGGKRWFKHALTSAALGYEAHEFGGSRALHEYHNIND